MSLGFLHSLFLSEMLARNLISSTLLSSLYLDSVGLSTWRLLTNSFSAFGIRFFFNLRRFFRLHSLWFLTGLDLLLLFGFTFMCFVYTLLFFLLLFLLSLYNIVSSFFPLSTPSPSTSLDTVFGLFFSC